MGLCVENSGDGHNEKKTYPLRYSGGTIGARCDRTEVDTPYEKNGGYDREHCYFCELSVIFAREADARVTRLILHAFRGAHRSDGGNRECGAHG